MKHLWMLCPLLTACIVPTFSASIKREVSENGSPNLCRGLSCSDSNEKVIRKRQTTITLESAASCNATRLDCIFNCRGNADCLRDCPICPEIQAINGMRRVIVEGVNDSYIHDSLIKGTNVTTVIKLVNLVNNTNLIDIPTNVNLTNQNHVHVYQNDSSDDGGEYGLGYNRFGSCCIVIEPKSCTASSRGYNCHHKRHKTCGQQCTSRIIHAESRHRCSNDRSCAQRTSYIPQPRKPRCVYTRTWPFVSCGGHHQQNCEGCYGHYGYGAHSYYGGQVPPRCYACYDDAFNMGPLYRRGPMFRPFFYHQPPCYLTGTCHMPYCGSYGCFGHEYMDPSWGYLGQPQMQLPMPPPFQMQPQYPRSRFHVQHTPSSFVENSPDYVEIEDNLQHIPADGADWGVEVNKCRVVEHNGTVSIKNCTDTEWDRNPFAASPSVYPHPPVETYEDPDSYGFGGDLEDSIQPISPSEYEGFERTQWDNEIPTRHRNLHRRHTRLHRKHQIIYDE